MGPLNDEAPEPTKREALSIAVGNNYDVLAQAGLTVVLAIAFTIMGAPTVALGIMLGVAVAFSIGLVR